MYRRRTARQPQQEKKEEKKEDVSVPVIKRVVSSSRTTAPPTVGNAPMLNVLRPINYFGKDDIATSYSVPFNFLIDIVLSKGYLNADIATYFTKPDEMTKSNTTWSDLYQETTLFKRTTLLPGDVIYVNGQSGTNNKFTFAFLTTSVYIGKGTFVANKEDSNNDLRSRLNMNPPIGSEADIPDPELSIKMSTCTNVNGRVYAFKKDVKFEDIEDKISKNIATDTYRSLDPTNASIENGYNTNSDAWTAPRKDDDEYEWNPAEDDYADPNNQSTNAFNLQTTVSVEGWLIYMRSSTDLSSASAITQDILQALTGDIIKTTPTSVGTYSNITLDLGSVFKIPYCGTGSTVTVNYNGNSTRFAATPINSESYQSNYGDSSGTLSFTANEVKIYSLSKFVKDVESP